MNVGWFDDGVGGRKSRGTANQKDGAYPAKLESGKPEGTRAFQNFSTGSLLEGGRESGSEEIRKLLLDVP